MNAIHDPRKPAEPEGGPESILPGERSGEGSKDLFKHIVRDEQRKAGLPRRPFTRPEDLPKPKK